MVVVTLVVSGGSVGVGVSVSVSVLVVVELSADSGVAVGLAAGATVSVFCSQATRIAAPQRRQRYFVISRIFAY